MPPLDTRIPLLVQQPQIQDPMEGLVRVGQLRAMQDQAQLRQLQLVDAQRQAAEQQQLRQVGAQSIITDPATGQTTFDTQRYLGGVMRVNPQAGMELQYKLGQQELAKQKAGLEGRKLQAEIGKAELEQNMQQLNVLEGLLSGVTDQASYDAAKAQFRQLFPNMPLQAPPQYDPGWIKGLGEALLDKKAKVEQAWKEQDLAEKKRHNLAQEQLTAEGHTVQREGHAASLKRAQIEAGGMIGAAERAGQKAFEVEKMKLAAQREFEPLTGEAAKSVSELNTVIGTINDIGTLWKPDFTSQVTGRTGAVREFTGDISTEEVQFRQKLKDVTDQLLRARSGAAITEGEYNRLAKMLPQPTDPPNVFQAKLEGFAEATQRLRDERLRTARTGRGSLEGPTIQVPAAPPAPPSKSGSKLADPLGIR